jgi:putative membrane protein
VKYLAIRWVALAATVWLTTLLVPGIDVDGRIGSYLAVAAVLATVNAVLGTLLRLFTFPLIFLTLGLFSLVISAWMLLVTDWMMETLTVDGFGAAFAGAIVIAIVNVLLDLAFMSWTELEESRRAV